MTTRRRVVDGFVVTTDEATSARLGRIRQHGTTPELVVRRILHALGARFRTRNRDLAGSPDIANRSRGWAVFVHGCYWHRHEGCRKATTPTRNREFWVAKFDANVARDRRALGALEAAGYEVAVIWECETEDALETVTERLRILTRDAHETVTDTRRTTTRIAATSRRQTENPSSSSARGRREPLRRSRRRT